MVAVSILSCLPLRLVIIITGVDKDDDEKGAAWILPNTKREDRLLLSPRANPNRVPVFFLDEEEEEALPPVPVAVAVAVTAAVLLILGVHCASSPAASSLPGVGDNKNGASMTDTGDSLRAIIIPVLRSLLLLCLGVVGTASSSSSSDDDDDDDDNNNAGLGDSTWLSLKNKLSAFLLLLLLMVLLLCLFRDLLLPSSRAAALDDCLERRGT
jgi:hypothetical protein